MTDVVVLPQFLTMMRPLLPGLLLVGCAVEADVGQLPPGAVCSSTAQCERGLACVEDTCQPGDSSASGQACLKACETFKGGKCFSACAAYCSTGFGVESHPPSDFEGVIGISCNGQRLNMFTESGSFSGPLQSSSGDNGQGVSKRAFVTATRFRADLRAAGGGATGLEGADNLCSAAAAAASLGGTWKAWLSSSGVDAIDRISDASPWLNVSRTAILFKNKASLTQQPTELWDRMETESGKTPAGSYVWTGTMGGGRLAVWEGDANTCGDWTETRSTLASGWTGAVYSGKDVWTDAIPEFCYRGTYPIYCFEQ